MTPTNQYQPTWEDIKWIKETIVSTLYRIGFPLQTEEDQLENDMLSNGLVTGSELIIYKMKEEQDTKGNQYHPTLEDIKWTKKTIISISKSEKLKSEDDQSDSGILLNVLLTGFELEV